MAEVPAEGALGDLVCAYSQPQSPVMPHGHLCPVSDFILQASQTTLLPTHAVLSQAAPAAQNAFLPPHHPLSPSEIRLIFQGPAPVPSMSSPPSQSGLSASSSPYTTVSEYLYYIIWPIYLAVYLSGLYPQCLPY